MWVFTLRENGRGGNKHAQWASCQVYASLMQPAKLCVHTSFLIMAEMCIHTYTMRIDPSFRASH